MSTTPIIEAKNNLPDLIKECNLPLLIDFWASWCGPCRQLDSVIKNLAKQFDGRLQIIKVNVDDNQETVKKYQIQKIPTMIVLDNEQKKIASFSGYLTLNQMIQKLQELSIFG